MNFHPYSIGALLVSDNTYSFGSFRMKLVDNTWIVLRYCMGEEKDEHIISFAHNITVSDLLTTITPSSPTVTQMFIELVKLKYKHLLTSF